MNTKVRQAKPKFIGRNITDLKDMITTSGELYKNNVAYKYKTPEGEIIEKTYLDLNRDMNSLGTALLDLGLKGKKIAVIGSNSYKWGLTYLATVCGVGTIVPIDKALPTNEIENLLSVSEAEAIFFEYKYLEYIKDIKTRNNVLKHCVCFTSIESNSILSFDTILNHGRNLVEKGDKTFADAKVDPEVCNMLIFTSGTTSMSKAVMLSHKNLCSNIMGVYSVIEYRPDDVLLSFLPIHHTLECTVTFLTSLYSGACIAICEGLRYIADDLVKYKVSVFASVPLVLENMYKKLQKAMADSGNTLTKEQILGSLGGKLRFVLVGAAALGRDVILGFNKLGVEICQGYGLTETSPVLTAENVGDTNAGSIGITLPNVEVEIDNPDENGMGEIKAKGPNIMLGYYKNEEATNEVLKNGWFYTGDLGYVDDKGFLFISGRSKNVIVLKNGKKIFPEEVEVLVNNHPLVAESFVYGNTSSRDGDVELHCKIVYNKEAIKATLGDATEEEILRVMDEHRRAVNKLLPLYKSIRKISITEVPLIKTTTGKIKRNEEMKTIA